MHEELMGYYDKMGYKQILPVDRALGLVSWWAPKSDNHNSRVQFLLPDEPYNIFGEASIFERLALSKNLYLEELHPPPT